MNSFLNRKPFVTSLIEILTVGITHQQLDDAETLLRGIRVLRPHLTELGTFGVWIAIGRRQWHDAIQLLNELDATAPKWTMTTALMAFCKFAIGDAGWHACASQVLQNDPSGDAADFVRHMMGHKPADESRAGDARPAEPDFSQYDPRSAALPGFLRA